MMALLTAALAERRPTLFFGLILGLAVCGAAGCGTAPSAEVVVYSALDGEFSEPVLKQYAERNDVDVRWTLDAESTKTIGLVNRLIEESRHPRCDLFWNNEILQTLRLEQLGLLEPVVTPAGNKLPPQYRSPNGCWYGFAARARILVVNTEVMAGKPMPDSIHDLVDPQYRGRVGIAKPLFGTTATHAAVLFASWGDARAKAFFAGIKDNCRIMSGNKQVALAVGRGELAFGLTDTDDAIIEIDNGRPVTIVFPDQADGAMGTLFIPNTVCLIKGSPNAAEARRLLEYLLQPSIEEQLASGRSAQFPINPEVLVKSRAAPEAPLRWMPVDFGSAAARWDDVAAYLAGEFASVP